MTLFSETELQRIKEHISNNGANTLITFRHKFGPTKLMKLWEAHLLSMGLKGKCIHWWSSSGTIGLIECELEDGRVVFGQYALGDHNELLAIITVENDEIANIKDGFDAGNVSSFAMRAIRIGETGED